MPTVTVVMSVYNGGRYLRAAVDSILGQTFSDFQFVIVNDASTDDTSRILASYDDPRIILLHNEKNLGLAASLNRAIEAAAGKYVARQDADDVSHPQRLAAQVAYLQDHPSVGVVGTTTEWIDEEGEILRVWLQPTDSPAIQETMLRYCCLIHGSTMYRHQAIDELGGYDSAMQTGQDYDLWLRLGEGWDLVCLPEVLYKYRWHADMASATREEEQDQNARTALGQAIRRRQRYVRLALGLRCEGIPTHLRFQSRRQMANRYVSWSAGARGISRVLAMQFLLAAMLFDPTAPSIWKYMRGIAARKVGLGGSREGRPPD